MCCACQLAFQSFCAECQARVFQSLFEVDRGFKRLVSFEKLRFLALENFEEMILTLSYMYLVQLYLACSFQCDVTYYIL